MQQAKSAHSGAHPGTSRGNPNEISGRLIHFVHAISTVERREVETIVERLIAMLDRTDGDPDLEDGDVDYCPAGDDGCSIFWIGGRSYWGSGEDA